MLLIFAPILSVIALATGTVATVVAIVLNGPRVLRRRGEPPLVVLPPVPTAEMRERIIAEAGSRSQVAL